MRRLIPCAIAAALLTVAGCSTFAPDPARVQPIPETGLLGARPTGPVSITVIRDTGFGQGLFDMRITLNQRPVANLGSSSSLTFGVPPGRHLLCADVPAALSNAQGTCYDLVAADTDSSISIRAGIRWPDSVTLFRVR